MNGSIGAPPRDRSVMALQTTCIGAFPKPDWLPIRDWFEIDLGEDRYAEDVIGAWTADPEHDPVFRRATEAAVRHQLECGIDVPTDGEQRRENYVHYQCRFFSGFDFANLERRVLRNGAYDCALPAIRGDVTPGRHPILVRDFKEAQAVSQVPVKMTLPGPLTIIDSTADCHYRDDSRLAEDLADALNREIRALAANGCTYIQIDEPVFARNPGAALDYGIESLVRCLSGLPTEVTRVVHMCCGYPDRIDNPAYPKADHGVYGELIDALDGRVEQISIEDAHCDNPLALFDRFRTSTAIVGVVRIASSRIESVAEIRRRLEEVLTRLPRERVVAAPDCGLGFLGHELALTKLRNMVAAARSL